MFTEKQLQFLKDHFHRCDPMNYMVEFNELKDETNKQLADLQKETGAEQ